MTKYQRCVCVFTFLLQQFRPNYINGVDDADFATSKGFNYHQVETPWQIYSISEPLLRSCLNCILLLQAACMFVSLLMPVIVWVLRLRWQGPEWVWCLGYFLRARFIFSDDKSKATTVLQNTLVAHIRHLSSSPWAGLPEICNENGSHCPDGCPTQAWSASCLLDALYDAAQISN